MAPEVEVVIDLTNEQKINILEKTKEILGPDGEHWTKSCWWGIKYSDAEIEERLAEFGYDPDISGEELLQIDSENDYEIGRNSLGAERADEANVWCLMGAIEESAYRLGIIEKRDASERFAKPISLQDLVASKEEWRGWSVIDVNDNSGTTFETVRNLLDERLAQLRS